ncbi:MAG: T9SS type A sorting domain-containing protein [Candidatus Kapaibacteriota bacterium]
MHRERKATPSLALYNAQGNLVRTIKSAPHEAGEYSERLETGFLATGTYFLRLSGETAVHQRVVNVIK